MAIQLGREERLINLEGGEVWVVLAESSKEASLLLAERGLGGQKHRAPDVQLDPLLPRADAVRERLRMARTVSVASILHYAVF